MAGVKQRRGRRERHVDANFQSSKSTELNFGGHAGYQRDFEGCEHWKS